MSETIEQLAARVPEFNAQLRYAQGCTAGRHDGALAFARWLQTERGIIGENVDVAALLDQYKH